MNYTFGLGITLFNAVILVILISSYLYHKKQIKLYENEDSDLDYDGLESLYKSGEISFSNAVRKLISVYISKIARPFHFWMYHIISFLVVANFFAFITGILGYFIYLIDSPDLMLFARLSDRTIMCFSFIGLSVMGRLIFKKKP